MKTLSAFLSFLFLAFLTLSTVHPTVMTALFSPEDRTTQTLLEMISNARKSIHAAVYFLTDKVIAQALIDAKKSRNIDVKIILDPISTDPKYGKADLLAGGNIDTFVFNPKIKPAKTILNSPDRWGFNGPIMHNKFAIFDHATVWTGSFNWTVSANVANCENVIITNNREICKKYEQYFATLLENRCSKYDARAKKRTLSSLRQNVIDALKLTDDDAVLLEKLTLIMQVQ